MNLAWLHLAFALGGGLGAVARFGLTTLITHRYPLSTLIVNVSGCFLLGLGLALLIASPDAWSEQELRLYTGFCGGFTTFSSFAYQSLDLHRKFSLLHAGVNILASVALCVLAFLLGRMLGGAFA